MSLWGMSFSLSNDESSAMIVIMWWLGYIIMDYTTYEAYCAYMNSIYLHVYNWPNPYQYNEWYLSLQEGQEQMFMHPDYYTHIYSYAMEDFANKTNKTINTKSKLSRNQKRKQKKLELE